MKGALAAFSALGPEDRRSDTRHVWAYFQDVYEDIGEHVDEAMEIPATPDGSWAHVRPRCLYIDVKDDGTCFVMIECDCDWEEEHGLQMVWRDGSALCKAGPYDGHMTNANAYADPKLAEVVYKAVNEQFTTRSGD